MDGTAERTTGAQGVRALVVEDDDFTRTLVANLVRSLGIDVCATAAGVNEAMRAAVELRPRLALIDLDLGEGPTGVDLAHGLRRLDPDVALVMLTSYRDPTWAGVRLDPPRGVRWVVKSDVDDIAVLEAAVAAALERPLASSRDARGRPAAPISAPQMEILRLVAAGHTNAEIARRRSLTEDAVNKAITRLVRRLAITVGDSANTRVMLAREYHRITGTVSDRRD